MRTAGDSPSILGMVGMGGSLRILGINDIDVEAPLQGIILLIKNQDVPGVIGRVGTILGNGKVNIANFALGRAQGTDKAIGVVNVDQPVPEAVLAENSGGPCNRRGAPDPALTNFLIDSGRFTQVSDLTLCVDSPLAHVIDYLSLAEAT